MTEANIPVPRDPGILPTPSTGPLKRTRPPPASCAAECRETLTLIPEQDDPKPAETRFLADHAYRHADPDRNNGSVDFPIPHSQPVRSGEVAFPHRRPIPRPGAATPAA